MAWDVRFMLAGPYQSARGIVSAAMLFHAPPKQDERLFDTPNRWPWTRAAKSPAARLAVVSDGREWPRPRLRSPASRRWADRSGEEGYPPDGRGRYR